MLTVVGPDDTEISRRIGSDSGLAGSGGNWFPKLLELLELVELELVEFLCCM